MTFAQHLAWLRGNVTTLRGTVDEDRTNGERSDEELADMIMEAKRQCNEKNRDVHMLNRTYSTVPKEMEVSTVVQIAHLL